MIRSRRLHDRICLPFEVETNILRIFYGEAICTYSIFIAVMYELQLRLKFCFVKTILLIFKWCIYRLRIMSWKCASNLGKRYALCNDKLLTVLTYSDPPTTQALMIVAPLRFSNVSPNRRRFSLHPLRYRITLAIRLDRLIQVSTEHILNCIFPLFLKYVSLDPLSYLSQVCIPLFLALYVLNFCDILGMQTQRYKIFGLSRLPSVLRFTFNGWSSILVD